MRSFSTLAMGLGSLALLIFAAPRAQADIPNQLQFQIHQPFVVGNSILPAGKYDFSTVQGMDDQIMKASNVDGDDSVFFLVRPSIASHTPNDSELDFHRYGQTLFLTHLYEMGSKDGVATLDSSSMKAQARAGDLRLPSTTSSKVLG